MTDLPAPILKELNEKLISGLSSRVVSEWITKQGYRFSHNAIAEYNREKVQPALRISAKLQQIQALEESRDPSPIERAAEVKNLTKQALAADPIIAAVERLDSEVWATVEDAKAENDLKARVQALNVARGTIETRAKALQHPGFVASAAPQIDARTVVVVLPQPTAAALPAPCDVAEVIDVEAE